MHERDGGALEAEPRSVARTAPALRIALLARYFPPTYSGAGLQAAYLARWLAREGASVTVLTPRPRRTPPDEFSRSIPARVVRFPTPRPRRLRDHVLGLQAALWLLAHRDWDLLHLLDFSYHSALPMWVARRRRRPVLIKTTLLDPRAFSKAESPSLLDRLQRWGYGAADAVVALSDALEADLRERRGVRGPVVRVPNGVDTELFRPACEEERQSARRRFGLSADASVVATTGALIPRKNVETLLDATARMRSRPLELVLAGPESPFPEDRQRLEAALTKVPEDVRVLRTGSLAPPRVAELLRTADLFVLPSRAEGMPNALLEAMASGLPCVASDIPGSRDVLAAGGGLCVPVDDAGALAEAADRLLAGGNENRRLCAEARSVATASYGMDRVAATYLQLYRELVGGVSAPGSS